MRMALTEPTRTALTEGQVRIRAYRLGDEDALFEAVSESIPEVSVWLPWCHPGYSRTESAAWVVSRPGAWKKDEAYDFAIEGARDGRFLGGCGLRWTDRNSRCANLGYWVRSSCAGRGVATAAARLVARFGFEDLGLQRIEILAAVENHASRRVAEKLGAAKEGILRRRFVIEGEPQDGVLYSLVAEDMLA